jgi:eukaryotic-like serine/threonine-protein kinase
MCRRLQLLRSVQGDRMPRQAFPWWLAVLAVSFLGYWSLLVYCDLSRIESLGLQLEFTPAGQLVVNGVRAGSPSARAGVRPGDVIESVSARPIRTRVDLIASDTNVVPGRPLEFRVTRDGQPLEVAIPITRGDRRHWRTRQGAGLLTARGLQLATLGFALLIAARRPRDPMALAAAALLASVGVMSITLPYQFAAVWRSLPLAVEVLLWPPFLASAAVGGAVFLFFAVFPRRALPGRVLLPLLLPLTAAIAWQAYFGTRILYARHHWGPLESALPVLIVVNVCYLAAGLTLGCVNYRRLQNPTDRRRLRVLLAGAMVGSLPGAPAFLHYWLGPGADVGQPAMAGPAMMAGALLFLGFPLSFVYATLRHRLFDISVIVRGGLRYALARHLLTWMAPVLLGVVVVDLLTLRSRSFAEALDTRATVYALGAVLAYIAHAHREQWIDGLDRRLFRERYNAQRLLREIAASIRQSSDLDSALPGVVERIAQSLHPASVRVLVRRPDEEYFHPFDGGPTLPFVLSASSTLATRARHREGPILVPVPDGDDGDCGQATGDLAALRDARIEVVVPVTTGADSREIVLLLGTRRSEEPYTAEDLDLLATIADGLALLASHAPVDATDPGPPATECPACGTCYDEDIRYCGRDGAPLIITAQPRRLVGRYRLDRFLGEGGMGTVYAATDLALERAVAVKLVRDELVASAAARDRFQLETRIAASFAHPNIVTVHDYGLARGARAFIVMELLRGESLGDRLKRELRLDAALALATLRDVCAAIEVAHARGVVHRDLKPGNIFLVHDQGEDRAKVLDFGTATWLTVRLTDARAATLIGTPRYMAPEQLRGDEAHPAWDLWALTVVACEMLTGLHPFAGDAPAAVHHGPGIAHLVDSRAPETPDLARFFAGALSLDTARRPPTVRALYDGLAEVLTSGVAVQGVT